MDKYNVNGKTIRVNNPEKEKEKLLKNTRVKVEDDFATLKVGIKIVNVEYSKPYVTLSYKTSLGEINKVVAKCLNEDNFDEKLVLEKALLKAFQNEINDISYLKNNFRHE